MVGEAEVREKQRLRREDRLESIRARHEKRHEAQLKIGVQPRNHSFGRQLENRRRKQEEAGRLSESLSMPSLALSGEFEAVHEQPVGDDFDRGSSAAAVSPAHRGIKGRRPSPLALPTSLHGAEPLSPSGLSPSGISPSGLSSRSRSRLARNESSPSLGMQSPQVAGLEGLLIPRFATRSPSPTPSVENLGRSASRTPPPRSPSPPLLEGSAVMAVPHIVSGAEAGMAGCAPNNYSSAGEMPPLPNALRPSAIRPSAIPSIVPSRSTVMGRTPAERAAAVGAALSRSQSAGGLLIPPAGGSVATAIASLSSTAPVRNSAPLLGWAESHGQSLGRPPRRSPFHFEAGLERHQQPVNPRPSYKSSAKGILTSESQIDVNLKSRLFGDGSQAYVLSPAVGQLTPTRWSPAHATVKRPVARPASTHASPERANLPPSPLSLARVARALEG